MSAEEEYMRKINERARQLEEQAEQERQAQQREAREKFERQQGNAPDNTILALADNIEKERKAKEAKMQAEENHGEMMSAINGLKDALISQNIINGNNHNASPSVQNNATERTMVKRYEGN